MAAVLGAVLGKLTVAEVVQLAAALIGQTGTAVKVVEDVRTQLAAEQLHHNTPISDEHQAQIVQAAADDAAAGNSTAQDFIARLGK
jgi:hypothetical protein